MTTLIESEIKAVKSDGIVWMIKGCNLFMTDEEGKQFVPFNPGSETYWYIYKQLILLKPIPESERVEILKKIMNTVKELI